jgi:DNA repair protein RadC
MVATLEKSQQNVHQLVLSGTSAPQRKFALATLAIRERPNYRVVAYPEACTTQEMLAAVIGGEQQIELAQALIAKFVTLRNLYHARPEELAEITGIGLAKATQIKAALVLGSRMNAEQVERPQISSPADIAALVQEEMSLYAEEHLRVIILDRRNLVLHVVDLYKGSVSSSQIRVGEVFEAAIRMKASAIAICHNHPSGDPSPSPDDVAVTRAIVQAGKLLDIDLLDHLIIGHAGKFVSLKERGIGFG